jgi:hypothetical protein
MKIIYDVWKLRNKISAKKVSNGSSFRWKSGAQYVLYHQNYTIQPQKHAAVILN